MILDRATKFGCFPAIRLGKFYTVWGFSKWRIGFYTRKRAKTKNGVCDLWALNLGRWMFLYETPEAEEERFVQIIDNFRTRNGEAERILAKDEVKTS